MGSFGLLIGRPRHLLIILNTDLLNCWVVFLRSLVGFHLLSSLLHDELDSLVPAFKAASVKLCSSYRVADESRENDAILVWPWASRGLDLRTKTFSELSLGWALDALLPEVVDSDLWANGCKANGELLEPLEHDFASCTMSETNSVIWAHKVLLVASASIDYEWTLAADCHDVDLTLGKLGEQVAKT